MPLMKAGKGRSTVYNRIVTPEKLEQVNPQNLELENDFLDYLVAIDTAKSTLYQYKNNLHIFWCWNLENNNNKFFVDIKKREVARFQGYALDEWGWSPKRLRTVKATISSLSNFIENILDDEYEDFKSIVHDIKNPPDVAVRDKIIFTARELQKLLDKLVENHDYYSACFLAVAMNSGRRKSELTRFKTSYFNKANLICDGVLYKTPEMIVTKGKGLEGKLLYAYTLAKPVQPYIDLWMEERKRLGIRSQWLFPDYKDGKWHDKPIRIYAIDAIANKFSKILGKHFHFHSMRHYLVTYLSNINIPYNIIQDMIGWEDAEMVKLYDDTGKDENFEKFFGEESAKKKQHALITEL